MKNREEFIYGLRPVIEAIREGRQVEKLLIKQGMQGALYHELMKEVKTHEIPFQFVPAETLEKHTRKNHQGVLAWMSLIEYQDIISVLPGIFERGEDPLVLCLDGITDVRNFGAIIRSASCLGAHAVLIPVRGSARITADAIKTSAGALSSFPVCRTQSITSAVKYLKDSGLRIICADEKSKTSLYEAGLSGPLTIIMGSEDRGISRELLSLADLKVRIPVTGNIESLNVSVAAGIILYEAGRQRNL